MLIKRSDLNKIIAGYLSESLSDEIDSDWLPFSSKERGNLFRGWVNDNKSAEEIAELYPGKSDKTLGRSGSANNDYIKKAWKAFGDEFIEEMSGPEGKTLRDRLGRAGEVAKDFALAHPRASANRLASRARRAIDRQQFEVQDFGLRVTCWNCVLGFWGTRYLGGPPAL